MRNTLRMEAEDGRETLADLMDKLALHGHGQDSGGRRQRRGDHGGHRPQSAGDDPQVWGAEQQKAQAKSGQSKRGTRRERRERIIFRLIAAADGFSFITASAALPVIR